MQVIKHLKVLRDSVKDIFGRMFENKSRALKAYSKAFRILLYQTN